MKNLIGIVVLIFISFNANAIEVMLWVSKEDTPEITDKQTHEFWNKQGYFNGPCGWVQTKNMSKLPPPNSKKFVSGSEKVLEFDSSGNIISQWAMPVDSYVYAIAASTIYVRWENAALEISSTGELKQSTQKYIESKAIECPSKLRAVNGISDYTRCTEHTDISNGKSRLMVYEGACT